MRPEDRERTKVEVVSRIVQEHVERARTAPEGYLETLVNDTLYHERQRLEREDRRRARDQIGFYDEALRRMSHASDRDLRDLVEQMSRRFVDEVVGNFDERVYRFATSMIPTGLWALLNAMSPRRLLSLEGRKEERHS